MNLYELTGEYLRLYELANDPEIDMDALAEAIEEIDGAIDDKAEGYGKIIRSINADVDAIDEEIKRLQSLKKSKKNAAERMTLSLFNMMKATEKPKIKTPLFSFSIRKAPASLVIDEGAEIPEKYLVEQDPIIDRAAIKDALKAGEDFAWARLQSTEYLSMR